MFVLALLEDTVVTKPHELGKENSVVIKKRLSERLSNKIVPNLGLCVTVYDLVEVGSTYILPGEGYGHTRVKFRMIVFRPHIGEIIDATVKSSSPKGITLSLGFFEDVFIPADKLPEPHRIEADNIWYWEYADDGNISKLFMDPGKAVRFRVVDNIFKDVRPDLTEAEAKVEKSYEIIGSMGESGLGCIQWWTQEEVKEEEEDDDDDMGEE